MIAKIKVILASHLGGGLSRRIFKNSSYNAARGIFLAFLSFITIPFILGKLGSANYGVWALIVGFASYSNFLELGFNSAVTRLVAQGNATNNNSIVGEGLTTLPTMQSMVPGQVVRPVPTEKNIREDIADQINSTVLTYFFASILIFLIICLIYPLVKSMFFKNINIPNLDLYILGMLALFFLNLITSNYLSVLTGILRMDLTNFISILSNVLQTVVTIGMLLMGYGLMAMFVGSVVTSVVGSVLAIYFAKREYPELFIDLRKYSFAKIKHLFNFSLKMYFINSVSNFLSVTNKFIIVRLTGLDFVAYYEIANKVVLQLRILFQNILEPVYPASAMVVSTQNIEHRTENIGEEMRDGDAENTKEPILLKNDTKTAKAYNKAFKYLLIISALGYGAMILLSYPVFLVWLGKKYAQVSLITIIIGIGNFVNLQTAIPFFFLSALNRLHLAVWSAILVVVCNFAFGITGFYLAGFYGMISGFSLALVLPALWFVTLGKKEVLLH